MGSFLRSLALIVGSILLLGSSCGSPSTSAILPGAEGCTEPGGGAAARAEVLRLVNEQRTAAGLGTLTWHQTLGDQADQYACEMIECGVVAHDNPCTGTELADRSAEFGYEYELVGENLARGYATPAELVAAWMDSPAHRANILRAEFTEGGVGVAVDAADGDWYWVLELGLPSAGQQGRVCAEPADADTWGADVLARINAERAAVGAPPLVWHAALAEQAQTFAGEMCVDGFVGHVNPRTGATLRERSEAAGYVGLTLAEILGTGPTDSADAVAEWLANSSYRQQMLSPTFQDVGVGVSAGGSQGTYWVLELGEPRQGS
ncbi:MAG: CAP domain-containing protein [Phycisphaerae bacterium]|jgi:uncharacterized protein YkwD